MVAVKKGCEHVANFSCARARPKLSRRPPPMLALLRPLHAASARWPRWLQAIVAPVQALHLQQLEKQLAAQPRRQLEATLRPVLLPNERWEDADSWRHNLRLLNWLRNLHLGALDETHSLLPLAEERLVPAAGSEPPAEPPSMAEIRALFRRTHPDGRRPALSVERAAARHAAAEPAARSGCTREVPWADLLDASGGLVRRRGAFNFFCEKHGVYEMVSKELVDALAEHIVSRADALRSGAVAQIDASAEPPAAEHGGEVRVHEVGAGHGELAYHLQRALSSAAPDIVVSASDNHSWRLPGRRFPGVLPLSSAAALRKVKPHLVLCGWMPMGTDWSAAFRASPTVAEYILLGEAYDGSCGHNWATWGNPAFAEAEPPRGADAAAAAAAPTAPHEADGFEAIELRQVSRWMLSRFAADEDDAGEGYASCAVAFRRRERRPG